MRFPSSDVGPKFESKMSSRSLGRILLIFNDRIHVLGKMSCEHQSSGVAKTHRAVPLLRGANLAYISA
jgi:hypothetical protein